MFFEPNWVAVIAAAFSNMVVGFLWYGPILGKPWIRLSGLTDAKLEEMKKKGMNMTYLFSALGAVVMACVVGAFVDLANASTLVEGAMIGFWAWLGIAAPVQLSQVLYEGKSWHLYAINTGYVLVTLVLMGIIFTLLG
jgi:hypothetical protein